MILLFIYNNFIIHKMEILERTWNYFKNKHDFWEELMDSFLEWKISEKEFIDLSLKLKKVSVDNLTWDEKLIISRQIKELLDEKTKIDSEKKVIIKAEKMKRKAVFNDNWDSFSNTYNEYWMNIITEASIKKSH